MNNKHIFQTDVFTTWLEDGIFYSEVKDHSEIQLVHAQENTKIIEELSGNLIDKCPILVDLHKIKSISKEARDHFAMRNRAPGVSAIAIVTRSPVGKIIGNFFLGLNKPSVPTRLFNKKEEALKWLRQFVKR